MLQPLQRTATGDLTYEVNDLCERFAAAIDADPLMKRGVGPAQIAVRNWARAERKRLGGDSMLLRSSSWSSDYGSQNGRASPRRTQGTKLKRPPTPEQLSSALRGYLLSEHDAGYEPDFEADE